jgi:hypothetical protein
MQMILITNMGCYSSNHLTRISTPRFLGKKWGKGHNVLQRSSQAHHDLLSWIDWSTTSWNFSSFLHAKGKREQLWKDGSSQIWRISWSTHGMSVRKHFLSWQAWNTWKYAKGWESFKFGTRSCEYIWIVLTNHIKGEHWICNMVVAREGSNIVCFLWKHGFSCRYSMSRTLFYDISISLLKMLENIFSRTLGRCNPKERVKQWPTKCERLAMEWNWFLYNEGAHHWKVWLKNTHD